MFDNLDELFLLTRHVRLSVSSFTIVNLKLLYLPKVFNVVFVMSPVVIVLTLFNVLA